MRRGRITNGPMFRRGEQGRLRRSVIVKGSPDISTMDADELAGGGLPAVITSAADVSDDETVESTKIAEFVEK